MCTGALVHREQTVRDEWRRPRHLAHSSALTSHTKHQQLSHVPALASALLCGVNFTSWQRCRGCANVVQSRPAASPTTEISSSLMARSGSLPLPVAEILRLGA